MLDLNTFTLQKSVLEIRYDPAFPLWDRAGMLASRLRKTFAQLKNKEARPNQQVYVLNDKSTLQIEFEKSIVISNFPPNNLDDFKSTAEKAFASVIETLELAALSRVGFRVFFEKSFDSKKAASEFVIDQMTVFKRAGKYFNIEGKVLNPHFGLRWEDEAIGCLVTLQTIETKLEIEVPPGFGEVQSIDKQKNIAQLDIDYYAHATMPVSKFSVPALVENWMKLIRRDVAGFLNG
jgi:hypothetical protein